MDYILELDHQWFLWLQEHCRGSWIDYFYALWRDKLFWTPLYLMLIFNLILIYRNQFWRCLILIILTITLSDQISSTLIKKTVKRARPCNEVNFNEQFEPIIQCSSAYSFPSSHACNHMALASLLWFSFATVLGTWTWLLFLWALSIGFAQIMVGVHFPVDVLAGSIIGLSVGWIISRWIKPLLFKV
ncbi:MAG TPA: phosphatase PAP2 family protein [Saprospiraceae bacterium]|nr:phosphatase PAP2 family protein [Saprospiraceae bacterium]